MRKTIRHTMLLNYGWLGNGKGGDGCLVALILLPFTLLARAMHRG